MTDPSRPDAGADAATLDATLDATAGDAGTKGTAGTERTDATEADTSEGTGEDTETSLARNIVEWIAILVGALAVALVVTRFLVQAFYIPSASMLPTLEVRDRILVNKLSYDLHEVNRGDLVVFERPAGPTEGEVRDLVKRVVALEGETVEARDGRLYVDGAPLDEPYLAQEESTTNLDTQVVPPGHVFVMGDNRNDSRDSRFFGPLPEERIIGRAFVKVWPLGDVGLL